MAILFFLFDPFMAYTINLVIISITAFFGMYMLLDSFFINDQKAIKSGISCLFALLPFWVSGGLTIAGQPFALYSFFRIRKNIDTKRDW